MIYSNGGENGSPPEAVADRVGNFRFHLPFVYVILMPFLSTA